MRDVTVIGVVCKIYDAITFMRDDGSTGQVRSLEMEDDTGSIRITLWNDDTNMELKKGILLKSSAEILNLTSILVPTTE